MTFLYILLAIVVLLVLITVHEFGHYCAGKIFGFKINEFSIGFGPAIFKKTKKDGEVFAVRLLPLGGYCAFEGEDEDGKDKPGSFNTMPGWKRLVVLVAGVTFNFLFGLLIAVIYLAVAGFATTQISATVNQQGVSTLGLMKNDTVIAVNGKNVEAYRSFTDMIKKYGVDENFVVTVERDGQIIDVTTKKQYFKSFYYVSNAQNFSGRIFDSDGNAVDLNEFIDNIILCSTAEETSENSGTGEALKGYLSTVYKTKENAGDENFSYASEIDLLIKGNKELEISPCISFAPEGVSVGIIQSSVSKRYGFHNFITWWAFDWCNFNQGSWRNNHGGFTNC